MNKKILTGTLAVAALLALGAGTAYAETSPWDEIKNARMSGDFSQMRNRMKGMQNNFRYDLDDSQRQELQNIREKGDINAIHEKLAEFGFEPRFPERFANLTEDQRSEIRELRQDGDKDRLFQKMQEFGLEFRGARIDDNQRDELQKLREKGDINAFMEKRQELGLRNVDHEKMTEHMENFKETGERGERGFFHRIGGFFGGFFK